MEIIEAFLPKRVFSVFVFSLLSWLISLPVAYLDLERRIIVYGFIGLLIIWPILQFIIQQLYVKWADSNDPRMDVLKSGWVFFLVQLIADWLFFTHALPYSAHLQLVVSWIVWWYLEVVVCTYLISFVVQE